MPRNVEKDALEEARRRSRLLEVGFTLFSQHGIENVSMNAVAHASEVSPSSLFRYYQTKEKLVVSISGMVWREVWQKSIEQIGRERFAQLNALALIRLYTDTIISIYQERPALLRFSSDYKTFICRHCSHTEDLAEHLDPLKPLQAVFHTAYLQAQTDRSIRTDIPEDVLFTTIAIGMLAMAERFVLGIVWAKRNEEDHTKELRGAQEMILSWCMKNNDQP